MFLTALHVRYNITIFLTFFGLILLFTSCNSTKYVPENKLLLTKNSLKVNSDKKNKEELNPYIIQKPNSKALGISASLLFYNLGNKNTNEKWESRINKYKDSTHFFTKVLSLKQTIGYANFRKNLNTWFFENGEAPVILNQSKTKKTIKNLKLYYIDHGYFNATVNYNIDTLSRNKAKVIYHIDTKEPYYIDSIKYQLASPIIDSLYQLHKEASLIKENQQYKRQNFEQEADRLTAIFRNAGVYHFSKQSINFRDIDSISPNHKTNVILDIADRYIEQGDSLLKIPYQLSYINKVKIYTDYSYLQKENYLKDSLQYKGINYYAFTQINYKPKYLNRSIFIKPEGKYSDINNELTRQHLRDLNSFSSIRIKYEEISSNQLVAHIFLTPTKRYVGETEAEIIHSNQKPLGISGKATFKNNNTFKGNEIFQIGFQGSFLNSIEFETDNKFFNAWELGVDASFKVPRFVLPFPTQNLIPNYMTPKTLFSLGTSLQKNIGLDKQRFTGIVDYSWKPNKKLSHTIELLNAQYIKNLNIESFFDVYKSEFRKLESIQSEFFPNSNLNEQNALNFTNTILENLDFKQNNPNEYQVAQNIDKRYNIITEDVLVPAITYQLIYNTQLNYKDTEFSYFRMRFASSGALSSLLAKKPDENNPRQILGINIAQYLKLDFEYRKHWDLNATNILAFRGNFGIAIPYGNSNTIPFSRSYFSGGPNDIRAWRIYELGPGSQNNGLEFNVGNLKLLSNLEYRFDIVSSFKGALFIDVGNIWDISNSDLTHEDAKFNSIKSLQSIAIGSGVGIRYDFSFLVFRADLGFKTYEPYNSSGDKWFNNYNIKKSVLNIGINYPF
jgi:outer membrane protein assembly factor BamA